MNVFVDFVAVPGEKPHINRTMHLFIAFFILLLFAWLISDTNLVLRAAHLV